MMNIDYVELSKIVCTSALTIIGGLLLLVAGQIIDKFFIEPIHAQSRTIGKIAFALFYYSNIYTNPGEQYHGREKLLGIEDELRKLAGELLADTNAIKAYSVLAQLGFVPREDSVHKSAGNLIGISHALFDGKPKENKDMATEVREALNFKHWV